MGCWGASANLERALRAGDGIAACLAISPTRFGWVNFLDLLRAGYTDYVLNDAAYDYMRNQGLPAATIALLKGEPETRFRDQTVWQAHLDRLGFNAVKVTPEQVRLATEGA